jgi:hypothetical protein
LLTGVLTGGCRGGCAEGAQCGVHRAGEDVGRGGLGAADHMGVHAKGDGGVGVPQAGRDGVNRDAREQQGRGMEMRRAARAMGPA